MKMKKSLLRIALFFLLVLLAFPTISFANSSYTDWENTELLPTKTGSYKLVDDVNITKQVIISGR